MAAVAAKLEVDLRKARISAVVAQPKEDLPTMDSGSGDEGADMAYEAACIYGDPEPGDVDENEEEAPQRGA